MHEPNISCFLTLLRDKGAELTHAIEEDADIAAQADHAESLADPVSGGFRRRRKKSRRHAMPPAGDDEVIHGLEQPRVVELRRNAHGYGEIVVTYPCDVDARNGDNRFQIFE